VHRSHDDGVLSGLGVGPGHQFIDVGCGPAVDELGQDVGRKKRPRDPNQLGKMILDISIGEVEAPLAPEVSRYSVPVAGSSSDGGGVWWPVGARELASFFPRFT
jgi:hypothetical protein